ncbi:MAG: radical SAM protein [Elusimicrobia bacterium]|nr:radical SAM protein [Elusimicrobiota bacterium]
MKISLIFNPNDPDELNVNFRYMLFRERSIGVIPPLSLLTVAAILIREGVEVQLIDMNAEKLPYSRVLKKIGDFGPDLMGFTLATYSFGPALKLIRKLKHDTGLPVLAGGPHAALYPAQTMSHREIDYAIFGEAEIPLPQFVKAFKSNRRFEGIKSIGYREGDSVRMETSRQFVKDCDSVPFPERGLIRNELYSNILTRKKNFTAMLSARGCPYRCGFCDQKNPVYRQRSAGNFVREVIDNYERHGIREFDVYDSTFTADKKRVSDICSGLDEAGLGLSWTVRSRVDTVDEEMLKRLKSAGCHTVFYGIESSSRDILRRMNKDISIERVKYIVNYTRDIGLDALGYFLFGYPGETEQTIKDTIDFSLSLPLNYAQFAFLVPMPMTEVYQYYMDNGMGDYWAANTLDPHDSRPIEPAGTELNREEVDGYVATANRRFYCRPRIVIEQLARVRSFNNLKRLAVGALSLFAGWLSGVLRPGFRR